MKTIPEDIKRAYGLSRNHPEIFKIKFFYLIPHNKHVNHEYVDVESQIITICLN